MPSMSEWRQPYLLSNLDLVTASFTLIAGKSNVPSRSISYRRWTPVVVSSETPIRPSAIGPNSGSPLEMMVLSNARMTRYSSESAPSGAGTKPARSNSSPLCTSSVASPPSSRIMVGPACPGQRSICSVHHQYSSSDSPFQAKTGVPCRLSVVPLGPTTTAAGAWSWVEKMLQLTQRTSAPSATRVSISTAVWIVMCSEPAMRDPVSGLDWPNSARMAMRPGISCSASVISARPKSASERSATLKLKVAEVMVLLGASDFQAPTSVAHAYKYRIASDADAELHDVAVTHHVLLAFDAGLAGRLHLRHGSQRHQVVVGDDLGLDEVLLEIGVDLTGRLGCGRALMDRPRA